MHENKRFWVGVTLSEEPVPDALFTVAAYELGDDGEATLAASPVIDPHVRADLSEALKAIAEDSKAMTTAHGWLTFEGFDDEPGSDVDFAFDMAGGDTVLNADHRDADEETLGAIRSACALLSHALANSIERD